MNMFERKPKRIHPESTETERLEKLKSIAAAARLGGGDEPIPETKKKESPAPPTPEEIKKAATLEREIEAARNGGGI